MEMKVMDELYWQKKETWPETAGTTIDYPEEPLFDMLDRSARQSGDRPYKWRPPIHCVYG
jgi:hypothetical protein